MEYHKKVKKNKVDKCNICGEVDQLTWEHVPPKSCGNSYHINTKNIFNTEKHNLNLDSQNGVKYRTICANCNSNILGANADLQLKQLYEDVKAFIENVKNTNNIGKSSVNLVQLIKCVFGKFLAMDKAYSKDKISESMRKFILKDDKDDSLHLYFRIYPYNTMIHGRTLVSKQVSGIRYSTTGLISILNFYPIAFTLSSEKENLIQSDLMQYVNFKNPNVLLEFSKNSAFNPLTKELLPHDWLISVDDNNILLTALGSLHTISNKK